MQRLPIAIAPAQLTAGAAAYYTAGSGRTATINNLSFTNTTANPVSVTMYTVPSGGSASAANMIMSAFSLAAGQTYVPPQAIGLQIGPGGALQAFASTASAVTIAGGVYETSGS